MKAIAIYNMKGGVGKTTAAVHIAHLSSRAELATLLWDLDVQGAASWVFRVSVGEAVRPKDMLRERAALWEAIRGSDWQNLDVLPADLSTGRLEAALRREHDPRESLRAALTDLGTRYERIVLDCPPALSLLTQSILDCADAALVPTIPTTLSLRALATLYRHLKPQRRRGLLVLPFFSMVDERKAIHRRVREFTRAEGLGFLESEIPYSAHVENSATRREPLTVSETHPMAQAFEALNDEVEERLATAGSPAGLRGGRLMEFLQGLG